MNNGPSKALTIEYVDDEVKISIGRDFLVRAVQDGPDWPPIAKIIDNDLFAREFARELNNCLDDDFPYHIGRTFDYAAIRLAEYGSDSVDLKENDER